MVNKLTLAKYNKSLSEADLDHIQSCYENSLLSVNKDEFVSYYTTHLCRDTAKHFSIGLNTVTRLAAEYSCLKCIKRHTATPRKLITKDALAKYYIEQNHSLLDTAAYFSVDKSTIIRLINDYNLFKKSNCKHFQNRALLNSIDKDKFTEYYQSHTAQDTMHHFKLASIEQVKYMRKKFGISTNKSAPKIIIRTDILTGTCVEYHGSYEAARALLADSTDCTKQLASISRAIRLACTDNKQYNNFI